MAAIRPNDRREKPRCAKSRFICSFSWRFIQHPSRNLFSWWLGQECRSLPGSKAVDRVPYIGTARYEERTPRRAGAVVWEVQKKVIRRVTPIAINLIYVTD